MPRTTTISCKECSEYFPAHDLFCSTCGEPNRANVSLASLPEPKAALEKRYQDALQRSEKSGNLDKLKEFEKYVQTNTEAVISLDVKVLSGILREGANYVNYHKFKGIYTSGDFEKNGRRKMIDSRFFAGFSDKIIFAALSGDGKGLTPYGNCTITLKEKAIANRSTLLEEDSFRFFEKLEQSGKKIEFENTDGYIATWNEKHKLAVVKLADNIKNSDTNETFARHLLYVEKDKSSGKFIEIHILRGFGKKAISALTECSEDDLPIDHDIRALAKAHFQIVKRHFSK